MSVTAVNRALRAVKVRTGDHLTNKLISQVISLHKLTSVKPLGDLNEQGEIDEKP